MSPHPPLYSQVPARPAHRRVALGAAALLALTPLLTSASVAWAAPSHTLRSHACCRVPAGTVVRVALVDQVSSATQKRGDLFALRLAAPLIVDGRVVLRAGAPGMGQVIESTRPGIGGKPAEMVLAASYLTTRHGRLALDALQLARPGHDNSTPAQVLSLAGIAFAPLGIVGILLPGGDIAFRAGTTADAKVALATTLPPLGRASRSDLAAAARATAGDVPLDAAGSIPIPPPPPGQGQVVFFRAKSLLGTGQWFNVREAGKALGKLTNGAYFIQPEPPGPHTYTATLEPELRDHLKLNVDPGETYFVEGTLTGGLVISAADLSPSDRGRFNKAAKSLKPAPPPEPDTPPAAEPASGPQTGGPADQAGPTSVEAEPPAPQPAAGPAPSGAPAP